MSYVPAFYCNPLNICMTQDTQVRSLHQTSGQDRGVGRYTLPSHTTKRTIINFKTKNNQNCQKIKLYGNPTTKELKKKDSSRPVRGVKRTCGKVTAGGLGPAKQQLADQVVPHSHTDKLRGTTREQDKP